MRLQSKLRLLTALAVLSALLLDTVSASVTYDTVLTFVILELVFAFGVGIVCIIFSFSLVRSLGESKETMHQLPDGDFPSNVKSKAGRKSVMAFQQNQNQSQTYNNLQEDGSFMRSVQGLPRINNVLERSGDNLSEMDSETQPHDEDAAPQPGLVSTFTSYLKLW